MTTVAVLGIDLAKHVFHLHGVDAHGRTVVSKRVSRAKLVEAVELIALSACETAVGLAGVAVKAGARSALATLWRVSDAATAVAAAEFYRQLGAEDRPSEAEALRRAQLMLLADARYREPFYWAPFLLIGNWL